MNFPDKNLNIDHPDTPLFNSLPINLKDFVSIDEGEIKNNISHSASQILDPNTQVSIESPGDQGSFSYLYTMKNIYKPENKNSPAIIFTDEKHNNIFEYYKADSRKNNITEIKEEEEMTMSQELTNQSIHEIALKRNILKGEADSDNEGATKKVVFRDDPTKFASKGSSYD